MDGGVGIRHERRGCRGGPRRVAPQGEDERCSPARLGACEPLDQRAAGRGLLEESERPGGPGGDPGIRVLEPRDETLDHGRIAQEPCGESRGVADRRLPIFEQRAQDRRAAVVPDPSDRERRARPNVGVRRRGRGVENGPVERPPVLETQKHGLGLGRGTESGHGNGRRRPHGFGRRGRRRRRNRGAAAGAARCRQGQDDCTERAEATPHRPPFSRTPGIIDARPGRLPSGVCGPLSYAPTRSRSPRMCGSPAL